MADTMSEILHPEPGQARDPDFPYAPPGWDEEVAARIAIEQDLVLDGGHWEVIQFLQQYCGLRGEDEKDLRHMSGALDEEFRTQGGRRYLYQLFPRGPINQGCRIAGLEPPPGAIDPSFGSAR